MIRYHLQLHPNFLTRQFVFFPSLCHSQTVEQTQSQTVTSHHMGLPSLQSVCWLSWELGSFLFTLWESAVCRETSGLNLQVYVLRWNAVTR